jgi:hypothetical protein
MQTSELNFGSGGARRRSPQSRRKKKYVVTRDTYYSMYPCGRISALTVIDLTTPCFNPLLYLNSQATFWQPQLRPMNPEY